MFAAWREENDPRLYFYDAVVTKINKLPGKVTYDVRFVVDNEVLQNLPLTMLKRYIPPEERGGSSSGTGATSGDAAAPEAPDAEAPGVPPAANSAKASKKRPRVQPT